MYRCNIDDSSPLVRVHSRQDGFGQEKRSRQHDFKDLAPLRLRKLSVNGRDMLDARVVYQDVNLTPLSQASR